MAGLDLSAIPDMKTGMLIRRAPRDVFEAIVDSTVTTKFWFTKSTGRLEVGTPVRWTWEMYDVSADVTPRVIAPHSRVVIEWPGDSGLTTVEWNFESHSDGTFVRITESGFAGDGDSLVKQVMDSTQGFSLMLAGLKAYLEHGIQLNLVADRYPPGVEH